MPVLIRLTDIQLQAMATQVPVLCAGKVLTIGGVDYTAAEFAAVVTTVLKSSTALAAARDATKAALLAQETVLASEGKVVREGRDLLEVMFNGVPASLSALAIPPRKVRAPRTAAENAAAAAKAKATRKARGTQSKKQKAAISGDVIGVTITPITVGSATPAATPPATTPAATGPTVGPVAVGTAATHG